MRGSTVHGVGKYGVRVTCVGSDDYLPTLPYLRLCFSLFYFVLGRGRVGQVGRYVGYVRAGIQHRMAWDEWNRKASRPASKSAFIRTCAVFIFMFSLGSQEKSPPENEWLPLLSYFRQTQNAGFSGAGTSYVHIFTSLGGAGALFLFSFIDLLGLGSALDIG